MKPSKFDAVGDAYECQEEGAAQVRQHVVINRTSQEGRFLELQGL